MSKDDYIYIYSYVERKIINTENTHTFDEERYKVKRITEDKKSALKAMLFGAALGLIVVGIIIFRDLSKY